VGRDHEAARRAGVESVAKGVASEFAPEVAAAAANGEPIAYARQMLTGAAPPRDDVPCTSCAIYLQMKASGNWLRRPSLLQKIARRFKGRARLLL
jgi:hypothetical protein